VHEWPTRMMADEAVCARCWARVVQSVLPARPARQVSAREYLTRTAAEAEALVAEAEEVREAGEGRGWRCVRRYSLARAGTNARAADVVRGPAGHRARPKTSAEDQREQSFWASDSENPH
jgi:hypothetical protein